METIKTRVNRVFYQNESEEIKEQIIYNYEKVTMKEAEEYLRNTFKRPKLILKVIMEEAEIKASKDDLKNNTRIIKENDNE